MNDLCAQDAVLSSINRVNLFSDQKKPLTKMHLAHALLLFISLFSCQATWGEDSKKTSDETASHITQKHISTILKRHRQKPADAPAWYVNRMNMAMQEIDRRTLTKLGRYIQHQQLEVEFLRFRKVQAYHQAHPQAAKIKIKPIVITGPYHSGTTNLHNLLLQNKSDKYKTLNLMDFWLPATSSELGDMRRKAKVMQTLYFLKDSLLQNLKKPTNSIARHLKSARLLLG